MGCDGVSCSRSYRVCAVEPDQAEWSGLALRLDGVTTVIHRSIDEMVESLPGGTPVVAVFGPSMADEAGMAAAERLGRTHPEIGVVLVTSELSTGLLQVALRAGVRDAVAMTADGAQVLEAAERVGRAMVARSLRAPSDADRVVPGRVIVAFSTKGGVGKSVIATNLAVSLSRKQQRPVVIVDADLQFGDVAVMLDVRPRNTTLDVAAAIDGADFEMMNGLLTTYESTGMRVLPAPIEPSAAAQITAAQMLSIVSFLRTMFGYIVVDLSPHFDDVVVALLDAADDVLMVASMDIPSVKNLKVGIQTLDLLALTEGKMQLVLNRADAHVSLAVGDVEKALGVPAEFRIPSDVAVPRAVNRGIPVTIDKPRSAASLALERLAESFLDAGRDAPSGRDSRRRSRRRSDKLREG